MPSAKKIKTKKKMRTAAPVGTKTTTRVTTTFLVVVSVISAAAVFASVSNAIAPLSRVDSDRDLVLDIRDNCPQKANKDQKDTDKDGKGDACDFQSVTFGHPEYIDDIRDINGVNGSILACGSYGETTTPGGEQKQDAWMFLVDPKTKKQLWEIQYDNGKTETLLGCASDGKRVIGVGMNDVSELAHNTLLIETDWKHTKDTTRIVKEKTDARDVALLPTGGVVLAGTAFNDDGSVSKTWLYAENEQKNPILDKTYSNFDGKEWDFSNFEKVMWDDVNKVYYVIGNATITSTDWQQLAFLLKIDASGAIQDAFYFKEAEIKDFTKMSDGRFAVVGRSNTANFGNLFLSTVDFSTHQSKDTFIYYPNSWVIYASSIRYTNNKLSVGGTLQDPNLGGQSSLLLVDINAQDMSKYKFFSYTFPPVFSAVGNALDFLGNKPILGGSVFTDKGTDDGIIIISEEQVK